VIDVPVRQIHKCGRISCCCDISKGENEISEGKKRRLIFEVRFTATSSGYFSPNVHPLRFEYLVSFEILNQHNKFVLLETALLQKRLYL